ncbi:MAG: glycosyltransferase family 2 protein [Prevotellaceae bacterium]|jgi:GT2 family glycosyltransferase|nr:glycosyltransferase family 2 protein [Prevotellaceae bacterium]
MNVSIVIVNYNTKKLLENCLKSVFEKTQDIDFEVIVVDNNSQDGSCEMVKNEFKNVILIENSQNLGFGAANNLGAKIAKGKYLFFLNPDTVLINNAVKILFDFAEKTENCGICGGNLFDENLQPVLSYGWLPSILDEITGLFSIKHEQFNFSDKPKKVTCITGADLMLKREIFEKIGGFDLDFFMYHEELELTFRVQKLGYFIYNQPLAQIVHLEGKSTTCEQKAKFKLNGRKLYYQKTHGKFYKKIADCIYFLIIISRLAAFKILRKPEKLKFWKYTYLTIKNTQGTL